MSFGLYIGPAMIPIAADSEITAAIWSTGNKTFVVMAGPCGGHHVMSVAEGRNVLRWLSDNLPDEGETSVDYLAAAREVAA
jgi:hypothetical protein